MPQGFADTDEAELDKARRLLDPEIGAQLGTWWLAPASRHAMTPNFDIASTCLIEGTRGLLLVEAKAHDMELVKATAGRELTGNASEDRRLSHQTIGAAIASARDGLERATSLPCRIARDSHYQMSNRFAWSWKLTDLGIPVVLIYLGFLNAGEMKDKGKPIADPAEWERLVKSHSEPLFPSGIWGRKWSPNGRTFVPLIRSIELPLGLAI